MNNETHYRKLENLMHSAPFVQLTGARVKIGEKTAEITIEVRREFHHAAHALHGAIYFLALDNAAFFAVNSIVEDVFVLTASFNIYITSPIVTGEIKAVGKVVHTSRNQWIAESAAYDQNGKEIARGSGIFVRSKIQLTPEVGYV